MFNSFIVYFGMFYGVISEKTTTIPSPKILDINREIKDEK